MSCFWQGVTQALAKAGLLRHNATPAEFSQFLRDNNALTTGVQWQGGLLSDQVLYAFLEAAVPGAQVAIG